MSRPSAATYTSRRGVVYRDSAHTEALFQALAAGEEEVQSFPHGNVNCADLESRMGFEDADGNIISRDEALARWGSCLSEELPI